MSVDRNVDRHNTISVATLHSQPHSSVGTIWIPPSGCSKIYVYNTFTIVDKPIAMGFIYELQKKQSAEAL
ncbi:hypothetical protein FRX31_020442 [Thalictrum thalictroides]|uniref:Uncharacterized protein n=1 Tax=Thalictrum thalictroides TaxID=46969 RepID=A0A7J6VXX0_THATH|nr:hypothetical protein FRX31_020442 [Thalictrum thalictroides]